MTQKKTVNIEDLVKESTTPEPELASHEQSEEYTPEQLQQLAAGEISKSPGSIFLLDLISRLDETVSNVINDLAEMHKTMLLYEGIVYYLNKEHGKNFVKEYLSYGIKRVEETFGKEAAETLKAQVSGEKES